MVGLGELDINWMTVASRLQQQGDIVFFKRIADQIE
jgi:hypothetical protein